MPYLLKGNSVVRSDTGQVVKTHPSREKALRHLRALKANVSESSPGVLGVLLEGFDSAKHPRGFGGKFSDALHKLDDYASSGKPHVGSDNVRQALTNVAVAQHLHAGGDERGAYGRLRLAHQKLGGGTEIGNQRGRAARLAVIGLMRPYESTPGTPRSDLKSAKVAGAADVVRFHRSGGREGKPAARIREARERPAVLGALLESR